MRGIFRKKANIWLAGAGGMIVGPWVLNTLRSVTGIGVRLPRVGNGS